MRWRRSFFRLETLKTFLAFVAGLFALLVAIAIAGWLLPLLWLASRKDSVQVDRPGEEEKKKQTAMDRLLMALAGCGLPVAAGITGVAVTWQITDVSNSPSDLGSAYGAIGAVGVGAIGGLVIYFAILLSSIYLYKRLRHKRVSGC